MIRLDSSASISAKSSKPDLELPQGGGASPDPALAQPIAHLLPEVNLPFQPLLGRLRRQA